MDASGGDEGLDRQVARDGHAGFQRQGVAVLAGQVDFHERAANAFAALTASAISSFSTA